METSLFDKKEKEVLLVSSAFTGKRFMVHSGMNE